MNSSKTIGITGAGGALGKCLTKIFRINGFKVIGFTHNKTNQEISPEGPNEWVYWECQQEYKLEKCLQSIDILILNHGIYEAKITDLDYEQSLEINALSKLKFLNLFKKIALEDKFNISRKEIWINTSEAEILPALSPSYEISKSLIGQLVTFNINLLSKIDKEKLYIRKIIIGPFKSQLNPIGIMSAELVASLIFFYSRLNSYLIIVSPNPISYIFFPIKELYYFFYCKILKIIYKNFK